MDKLNHYSTLEETEGDPQEEIYAAVIWMQKLLQSCNSHSRKNYSFLEFDKSQHQDINQHSWSFYVYITTKGML